MHWHVTQVGRRLAFQSPLSASFSSCAARSASLTQSARLLRLHDHTLSPFSSRAAGTYRNVEAQDITALHVRRTAPTVTQVGLWSGLRSTSATPRISQSVYRLQRSHGSFQKRWFSDTEVWRTQKAAETAARSKDQGIASSQAAKVAQEPASSAHAGSKGLLDRLPHLHRPTKYELLATAETFWQRVRVHFKWFSIRSLRPFTVDEIGAFISWVFLGHLVWIVIGTTTFVSLGIWALNTVFAQETLAGWVGNYLTKSYGLKVVFESAIVPTWRSGVITFNHVFVSRRPGQQSKKERAVSKGSPTTAAAAAEAAMAGRGAHESSDATDDGNYTQFDVTMETVNVTLSFGKWFNGKGLLRDVEIVGVRGVLDRTSVQPRDYSIDPKSYRHEHATGDFEIENFRMADVLLTVHQPDNFRPFTVSVFNCDLPRLRKQWLFYDLMNANNMSGSFDDSLFTVHPRQLHGTTGAPLVNGVEEGGEQQWKKHSRLRIDGLNIDHLNRGVEGTFSWIREGNVDIVADVMIPNDDDNIWAQSWRKSTEAMSDLYDRVEASVSSVQQPKTHPSEAQSTAQTPAEQSEAHRRLVIFDIKVHLNDVRASVPLFTKDLSYVNNALVRPIVAYINSRPHAFIPVNCRVVKRQSEFDGSWTIFDSGLLDDLSKETYEAFARDIEDVGARKRRMRKVGLWSLQLAAQALFIGLAGQLA
ncbi:hypothetical protein BDY17DRAFT_300616 [Neohortaea acidophila]|uniref:Uncharacterized protein n=1 Tax=Neohortaea acidophila TaxID=245834 RepID=A0A6A6PNP1_9PEZI|nr:uncharacterized protein BDY17DRAFT_300616 [Neohortaea acidophila]KAF2481053.1 hypothetical protein BDY17DRAFT_300616 [Neohortaea acidophila]